MVRFSLAFLACVASLVAVAAPVPPGVRVEFGTGGLLTRADLEKVKFDSRPAKGDDGAESKPKDAARKHDVAVHLPWTKFREGEPMPAYFVLRNNTNEPLGLDAQLSLHGPEPTGWNACRFSIRPLSPGAELSAIRRAGWRCGSGSLVDVPANDFYCVAGDLNRLTGEPLPAGEYEVDWACSGLRAAAIKFTVVKAEAKPAAPAKRGHVHFYHLSPGRERESSLGFIYTDSMAAALSVGQNGVYAPDIHTIPTTDKLIEASVEWRPYREGDRLFVTLRTATDKQVRFEEIPQLFLQIESSSEDALHAHARESEGEVKRSAEEDARLVTPLTIEVRLPKEWRSRVATGEARVAVLVAAKRIEFPVGNRIKLLANIERVRDKNPVIPVWTGIVRTPFTELRLPAPLPAPAR